MVRVRHAGEHGRGPPTLSQPEAHRSQRSTARRFDGTGRSLWSALQRVQENLTKGGLVGRSHNG